MQSELEHKAQQAAKEKLVDALVAMHEFPLPEGLINRQVEAQLRRYAEAMAAQGMDPRSSSVDWARIREAAREQAIRDVKATLLLERIADREAIEVTNADLDRELQRLARGERQPVEAVRRRLEQERSLGRLVSRIRIEKTLNLLFEQAQKVAED
jgi:trigger factor